MRSLGMSVDVLQVRLRHAQQGTVIQNRFGWNIWISLSNKADLDLFLGINSVSWNWQISHTTVESTKLCTAKLVNSPMTHWVELQLI